MVDSAAKGRFAKLHVSSIILKVRAKDSLPYLFLDAAQIEPRRYCDFCAKKYVQSTQSSPYMTVAIFGY